MTRQPVRRILMRGAATSVVAVSALGLTGCSDDTADAEPANESQESQETEEAERPFTGPYGADFVDSLSGFEGQEVQITGEVQRVIDDRSFLLESSQDASADPLLVVDAGGDTELEALESVTVTGIVHTTFDLEQVEEDLAVDLDPEDYPERDEEPYVEASDVETS